MTRDVEAIKQWIKDWQEARPVPSVSMGGIGHGYELALQYLAVTHVQRFIEHDFPIDSEDEAINEFMDANPAIEEVKPSGAMHGGAKQLAWFIWSRGLDCLNDEEIKDRRILMTNDEILEEVVD